MDLIIDANRELESERYRSFLLTQFSLVSFIGLTDDGCGSYYSFL